MHMYRYASEKTSAPVFFTLHRLNSPRITIEKRGTTRAKTLNWEWSIAVGTDISVGIGVGVGIAISVGIGVGVGVGTAISV